MNCSSTGWRTCVRASLMMAAAAVAALHAQEQPAATPPPQPPKERRFQFGGRLTGYLQNVLPDATIEASQESPAMQTTMTSSSQASRIGYGGAVEFRLTRKFAIGTDFLFHKVGYTHLTDIAQGANLQFLTTHTEVTRAWQWDVPLMVRYIGLRDEGWLSNVLVSGGPAARFTTNVRSNNETILPDDSVTTDETAAPFKRTLPGATAGIGYRYIDDYNFKLTPEVRYTRWFGSAFDNGAARMRRDQLEITVSITF